MVKEDQDLVLGTFVFPNVIQNVVPNTITKDEEVVAAVDAPNNSQDDTAKNQQNNQEVVLDDGLEGLDELDGDLDWDFA